MITSINHIGISTKNYRKMVEFYCDLIGFKVLHDGLFKGGLYASIMALEAPEGRVALLDLDGSQLEIFEFSHPEPPALIKNRPVNNQGLTHLCFSVIDIAFEYKRLVGAGMVFHCEPKSFSGEGRATYGRDPDGNVIELYESISD